MNEAGPVARLLVQILGDMRRLALLLDDPEVFVFLDHEFQVRRDVPWRDRKPVRSRADLVPLPGREGKPRTAVHLPALAAPWIGQRLARRLGRFPVEARVKATLALCFADPSRVSRQRFEEAIAEADRRARLGHESDAMLLSLRSLMSAYLYRGRVSLWAAAAQVRAPTLLIYGLKDKLVDPRTSARAARTYPDSRLLLLPDSGHVAQMEHPDEVARVVRRHVARVR